MPSLVEVNLNHNNLSHIYPFSVDEGSGVCFPSIEVIGLSGNQFKTLGDFLPLARLHRTLRRVVLSKNPIGRDNREVVKAKSGFDKVILDAYFERTKQQGKGDDNDTLWNKTEDLWNAETWERFLPNQEEGPNGNQQSVSTAAAKAAAASYAPAETSDRPQAPDVTTAESSARVFTERPQRTETGATMSAEEYLHSYHVDLIFTDVEMPKKSTREFYSSGRSAQQPLVTVPNYKEFMDIYRITGSTKEARNAPLKKTTRPQKQGVRVAVRTAATPTEEPSDEELEEYDEEVEVEVTDSDAEEEDGGDFFITGVDDETDTRKKKIIRTTVKMKRPKRSTLDTTESFDAGDATMATTTSNGPTAHNAVSELRNLLRKPLPHLPYSNTN
ncbi:hypothetical protein, conserved [Angomonas deanei]|uniref:Uncharacterized protein n=1 Tax=Angomonas deanei TaxID=59799 RepID=A0A7G2CE41_9TRYP|nr:hypothetical protein, conserved [Angomonas deanei]